MGAAAVHGAAVEGLAGWHRRRLLAPAAHVALLPKASRKVYTNELV